MNGKTSRHFELSRILASVIIVAGLVALALVFDKPVFGEQLRGSFGDRVFELLLQFLLITVIGGGVVAVITQRRNDQARAEVQIAGLQDLVRELGAARRAMKKARRQMRSRLSRDGAGASIERAAFEASIDEVLDAQIAIEEVQAHISVRSDLLGSVVVDQMYAAMHYAARYLHDVYEEHEKGKVQRQGADFVINEASPNLYSFLLIDNPPHDLRPLREGALETRFKAVDAAEADVQSKKHLRHARIATECFRIVMAKLRETITKRLDEAPYAFTR